MNLKIIDKLKEKYQSFSNYKIKKIILLKQSGSYRKYYRIFTDKKTILGVYNPDNKENEAFLSYAKHFYKKGFNVPQIFSEFKKDNIYFIEDLGNTTVFDYLKKNNKNIVKLYKKILNELFKFQFKGIKGLDLSKAYPRDIFDKQSIMWDLNYFKYFVLKIGKVQFDEQKLEDDFVKFCNRLTSVKLDYFLYRDFQSKNIMLKNDKIYFIDFQGGRKGAIYYDLASLLYDNKANISESNKKELLDYYYSLTKQYIKIDKKQFYSNFYHYVLIRILQAFGAYSFRGIIERKTHFIYSIPKAIENIKKLMKNKFIDTNLPELKKSLNNLCYNSELANEFKPLTEVKVRINSFSYSKKGYPPDEAGNGGGFVFDCRFLPNPHYKKELRNYTGIDKPIIEYLSGFSEVETFISQTAEIIKNSVKKYTIKKYTDLQVNFGCTGGKHRSVYCAETTANLLKNLYGINVVTKHLQLF